MTLSLNANFTTAMAKGNPQIRFNVEIHVNASTSYKFLNGICSSVDYPESVLTVTPTARSVDIHSHKSQINQVTITMLLDDRTQTMLTTYVVRGARCVIEIGEASLAEGDFEDYFEGIIADVKPKGKKLEIKVKSYVRKTLEQDITGGRWSNQHPLSYVSDIFDRCDMDSEWYDSTSLTPSTWTAISHWVCDRQHSTGWDATQNIQYAIDPVKAKTLIDQLMVLLNGHLHEDETGKITFYYYDPDAAAADSWTEDDYGDFEIVSLYDNLINAVLVKCMPQLGTYGTEESTSYSVWYWRRDTDSQTLFGTPMPVAGVVDNAVGKTFESEWIAGRANLEDAFTGAPGAPIPAAGSSFSVKDRYLANMCGTRWPTGSVFPAGAQDADAQLSDSRLAYLMIDDEIVECDRCVVGTSKTCGTTYTEYDSNSSVEYKTPGRASYRVKTRGALGTTAANHTQNTTVYDVTIPVAMAKMRIERFFMGGHVVRCKTNFTKYKIQLHDLLTLVVDSDEFLAYGLTGLTTAVKWEVIGKEVVVKDGDAYIQWTLLYSSDSGAPAQTIGHEPRESTFTREGENTGKEIAKEEDVVTYHVQWGCTLSAYGAAAFTFTLDAGSVVSGMLMIPVYETDFVTSANKDCYVGVDLDTGQPFVDIVNNGAAQPNVGHGIWLWKVVSDGAGIPGSPTDLRETDALDGARVLDGTIDTEQITDLAVEEGKIGALAVTEAKIGALAVTEAKLGPGSVTEGKIGALAVTSGKLGADSVIAGKIQDGAVDSTKTLAQHVVGIEHTLEESEGRNHNYDFSDWVLD